MSFHICSSLVVLDPTAGIYYPFPEAPKASKPVRYRQSHRAREIKLEERVWTASEGVVICKQEG